MAAKYNIQWEYYSHWMLYFAAILNSGDTVCKRYTLPVLYSRQGWSHWPSAHYSSDNIMNVVPQSLNPEPTYTIPRIV